MYRLLTLVVALAVVVGAAGCQNIAQTLGMDRIEIDTSTVGDLPLSARGAVFSSTTIQLGGPPSALMRLNEVQIPTEALRYAPPAQRAARTCPVDVYVLMNNVAVIQGSLSVNDQTGAVTNVALRYAQPYDRAALCQRWGFETCPLAPNPPRTEEQIRLQAHLALHSAEFGLTYLADNRGDCTGTLHFDAIRFEMAVQRPL